MRQVPRFTLIATCAVAALTIGWASAAFAYTTKSAACSTCHGTSAAVTVEAVQTANDGANATYRVTVSNPYGVAGWAVLADGVNIVRDRSATGTFRVAVGGTYTVWGVSNGAAGEGAASVQISPVAPPPAPPAPPANRRRLHRPTPHPQHRLRRLRPQPTCATCPGPSNEASPPAPSDETTPVSTGTLKIHIQRHGKNHRYTMTLVNADTGKTITVKGKRSEIVLKKVEYGTYALTLQVGDTTYTKNVVVEKPKTKVTIKLPKPSKHHRNSHGHDRGEGGKKK